MPGNQIAPPFAIMSQFDARPWAGLPLYTRPPDTISMPAFSGVGDGLFTDLLTFLNGRASVPGRVLDEDILATWTLSGGFPSVVNAYINADDRLVLESDLDFAVTAAGDPTWFGFDAAGQSAVLTGSGYRVTATGDWTRGVNTNRQFWIDPVGAVGAFFVPSIATMNIEMSSLLRSSSGLTTLEGLETYARGVRWGIDMSGRVGCVSIYNVPIIWQDDSFRDALGFTGLEPVVPMGGGLYAQLGTYPAYGVIRPTRPVTRQALFVDQEAEAVRLTGGGWAGVRRGSYIRHGIEWYLDGPADERDLHQHWLRRVAPRLTPGAPVSIYQDFPETRASVPEPSPYSTTQTPEKNGIRGVIDGQVYDISGSLAANWTRPLRRRVPMSLVVEETEALDG